MSNASLSPPHPIIRATALVATGLLIAVIGVAPAAAATDSEGIDLDSTSATFTFSGTAIGEPVEGVVVGSIDSGIWPEHPTAHDVGSSAGIDIGSSGSSNFTFASIDLCGSDPEGGIHVLGRNMPSGFDLTITDPATGAERSYSQTDGPDSLSFLDVGAFSCPDSAASDAGIDIGVDIPKRLVGEAAVRRVAGNRRVCSGGFTFATTIRGQGDGIVLERRFGGGAGRDRLPIVAVDPENRAAVFHTRNRRYSALMYLAEDDGTLAGWLMEGPPRTFSQELARTLLGSAPVKAARDEFMRAHTRTRGACGWRTTISGDQAADAVTLAWRRIVGVPPDGPIVPPDISELVGPGSGGLDPDDQFLVDFVTGNGRTEQRSVEPLMPFDDGLYWFFEADDPDIVVKVFDGRQFNDNYWMFAAAATDVSYDLTVTDQVSGDTATYPSAGGTVGDAVLDLGATACR